MQGRRRQLTLFISNGSEVIEKIRATFNPVQFNLIAAHVTLCRENEIGQLEDVIANIRSIALDKPIKVEFGPIERIDEGKGVLLPAKMPSFEFFGLRRMVLNGLNDFPENLWPHVTLMHPRNAVCTDEILDQLKKYELPTELSFGSISLIEQFNGGRWTTLEQFALTSK